jgi:hypothetical protein
VTPKGRSEARRIPDPPAARSVLAALHLVAGAVVHGDVMGVTGLTYAAPGVAHGAALWLLFNAALLALAIGRVRSRAFGPERRRSHRHPLQASARVADADAEVTDVSMTGARLRLRQPSPDQLLTGQIVLMEVDRHRGRAALSAKVERSPRSSAGTPTVHLDFRDGQYEERAKLNDGLFIEGSQLGGEVPATAPPWWTSRGVDRAT